MAKQKPLVGSINSQNSVIAHIAHVYGSTSWVATERDVAAEVVKELENRRVLYNDYELEIPEWVVRSVLEMREFLHEKLLKTCDEGALTMYLRAMRAACRKFLDAAGHGSGQIIIQSSFQGGPNGWRFFTALGELRSTVGLTLGLLMAAYELTCEPELARILPADPRDEQ